MRCLHLAPTNLIVSQQKLFAKTKNMVELTKSVSHRKVLLFSFIPGPKKQQRHSLQKMDKQNKSTRNAEFSVQKKTNFFQALSLLFAEHYLKLFFEERRKTFDDLNGQSSPTSWIHSNNSSGV